MDSKQTKQLLIRFENVTSAQANQLANELQQRLEIRLKMILDEVSVERHKPDPHTMDLGPQILVTFMYDVAVQATADALIVALMYSIQKYSGKSLIIHLEEVKKATSKAFYRIKNVSKETQKALSEFLSSIFKSDDDA